VTAGKDRDLTVLFGERVTQWCGRLRPLTLDRRSAVDRLPALVAEAYPGVDSRALSELSVGLSLFGDAVVLSDDIIDYAATVPRIARSVPRVAALYARAYRTFSELVGGDAVFWDRLEEYFIEYIDALDLEEAVAVGAHAWDALEREDCLRIVRGKNGLVRLVDAAVRAIAHASPRPMLAGTLLDYLVAHQMTDDVKDWREDVRDGTVSLLLRLACDRRPDSSDLPLLGRRLYLEGHVDGVLALAEHLLHDAAGTARAQGSPGLAALCEQRSTSIAAQRERLLHELRAAGATS
jgi:hypothetical protein